MQLKFSSFLKRPLIELFLRDLKPIVAALQKHGKTGLVVFPHTLQLPRLSARYLYGVLSEEVHFPDLATVFCSDEAPEERTFWAALCDQYGMTLVTVNAKIVLFTSCQWTAR